MHMLLAQHIDPFGGLAASIVTSNVVDTRDAYALTLSWRTSAGTTGSVVSYQVGNHASYVSAQDSAYNAGWATASSFGTLVGTNTYAPPVGYRFARLLRTPSIASYQIEMNKTVR